MKVGLIGIGDKLPNLALMKISNYHKALGDTISFGAGEDITYISCCFSKYRRAAEKALTMYKNSVVGGPAWSPECPCLPRSALAVRIILFTISITAWGA